MTTRKITEKRKKKKTAGRQWRSDSPNIAELPILIVVLPGLERQLRSELRRYLVRGSFDIFPYLGKWDSRKNWWQDIYSAKSKLPPGRRIISATYSVGDPSFFSPLTCHLIVTVRLSRATFRSSWRKATPAPVTIQGRKPAMLSTDTQPCTANNMSLLYSTRPTSSITKTRPTGLPRHFASIPSLLLR